MIFERENARAIESPSEKRVRLELSRLKSYGKFSFASLTAPDGSYVQVAGGTVNCAVEWRDVTNHRQFRAYQAIPKVPHPDGTKLHYSGGSIVLKQKEFLFIEQVAEIFVTFLRDEPFPKWVNWRDITAELVAAGMEAP